MPRDLFQPHHDATPRLARAGTVPVSLVTHAIAIGVAVLVPVLAGGALPNPRESLSFVSRDTVVPVVPPPPAPGARRAAPARGGAPITVPDGLPPVDAEPTADTAGAFGVVDAGSDLPFGATGGLPGGTGVVVGELPPPPPPRPVRVGGDIRPPVKVRDAAPVYPEIARAARVQGIVIIEATIDTSGRVTATRLLRSVALLDEAALAAVRQWVFTPTRLNGEPTPVVMTVTVQFRLD
jgi:protein TonB